MDPHHHQHQQQQPNEDNSGGGGATGGGANGSFLCRQSSARWTPTADQIRILKDLYYNSGVRSPSAEQIQRISARLRQYGKIDGKNVFYWFQNHKARERQKKRFTTDVPMQQQQQQRTANIPISSTNIASSSWKPEDYFSYNNKKHPNITTPGFSSVSSSSAGGFTVGQMGNYGYESVTMENSFRDCSISSAGGNYGWVGIDSCSASSYSSYDKQRSANETLEDDQEQEDDQEIPEIETLPLFPTQRENINGSFCSMKQSPICYSSYHWCGSDHGNTTGSTSRTSVELSLNSYTTTGQAPDSI